MDFEVGRFRDNWLTYMDILGYKRIVQDAVDSGTEAERIQRISEALDAALDGYRREENYDQEIDYDVHVLSDSIIFSQPCHPALSVAFALVPLMYIQAYLALDGLLVRGAVVRGGHYDDGELVFSPALIAGFQAETQLATYPRIILHRDIRREYHEMIRRDYGLPPDGRGQPGDLVWLDHDGSTFLNYLAIFDERDHDAEGLRFLLDHKEQVELKLQETRDDDSALRKIRWLACYHNTYCGHHLPQDVREDYLVTDAPGMGPWLTKDGLWLASETE